MIGIPSASFSLDNYILNNFILRSEKRIYLTNVDGGCTHISLAGHKSPKNLLGCK